MQCSQHCRRNIQRWSPNSQSEWMDWSTGRLEGIISSAGQMHHFSQPSTTLTSDALPNCECWARNHGQTESRYYGRWNRICTHRRYPGATFQAAEHPKRVCASAGTALSESSWNVLKHKTCAQEHVKRRVKCRRYLARIWPKPTTSHPCCQSHRAASVVQTVEPDMHAQTLSGRDLSGGRTSKKSVCVSWNGVEWE